MGVGQDGILRDKEAAAHADAPVLQGQNENSVLFHEGREGAGLRLGLAGFFFCRSLRLLRSRGNRGFRTLGLFLGSRGSGSGGRRRSRAAPVLQGGEGAAFGRRDTGKTGLYGAGIFLEEIPQLIEIGFLFVVFLLQGLERFLLLSRDFLFAEPFLVHEQGQDEPDEGEKYDGPEKGPFIPGKSRSGCRCRRSGRALRGAAGAAVRRGVFFRFVCHVYISGSFVFSKIA